MPNALNCRCVSFVIGAPLLNLPKFIESRAGPKIVNGKRLCLCRQPNHQGSRHADKIMKRGQLKRRLRRDTGGQVGHRIRRLRHMHHPF